jgi:hypothetical protein
MDPTPATFWEHVYDLRKRGLIDRIWKTGQLGRFLERPDGPYAPGTVRTDPFNYSISLEGYKIGFFVMKGEDPKAWRMGRGQFQLIADPEDDTSTRESELGRAMKRAEELRLRKRPENAAPSVLDRPYHPGLPTESEPRPLEPYPSIPVALTSSERQALGACGTEQKALYIVHKHLGDKYGGRARIEEDQDGPHLTVTIAGRSERIEVKGTESPTMAWPELKVSSQEPHDALKSGKASMYRVVDVGGANPRIYVLTYGRHFTLEPEPGWAVKQVPPKDARYPLRGKPYRYDLPYDPVGTEEWEARE